jgi:hypothetical protein
MIAKRIMREYTNYAINAATVQQTISLYLDKYIISLDIMIYTPLLILFRGIILSVEKTYVFITDFSYPSPTAT